MYVQSKAYSKLEHMPQNYVAKARYLQAQFISVKMLYGQLIGAIGKVIRQMHRIHLFACLGFKLTSRPIATRKPEQSYRHEYPLHMPCPTVINCTHSLHIITLQNSPLILDLRVSVMHCESTHCGVDCLRHFLFIVWTDTRSQMKLIMLSMLQLQLMQVMTLDERHCRPRQCCTDAVCMIITRAWILFDGTLRRESAIMPDAFTFAWQTVLKL